MDEADGRNTITVLPLTTTDTGEIKIPIKMSITENEKNHPSREGAAGGCMHVEDIIKVFVTSRPTTFPAMILPPLSHGGFYGGSEQLEKVLVGLENASRGAEAGWTSRNFVIRTFPKP